MRVANLTRKSVGKIWNWNSSFVTVDAVVKNIIVVAAVLRQTSSRFSLCPLGRLARLARKAPTVFTVPQNNGAAAKSVRLRAGRNRAFSAPVPMQFEPAPASSGRGDIPANRL